MIENFRENDYHPSSAMKNETKLNKHPVGSFLQISSLCLPLILSLLSGSLMGFCDRIFAGMVSEEALEGLAIATYLVLLFQVACIRISSTSQVFVTSYLAKGEKNECGVYTWQMIWFSLLSMLLIYPIGFGTSFIAFPQTPSGELGRTYFSIMMGGIFLYPLGATLGAFFIGQGKTHIISSITLISHALNIGLNYLLIFGWHPLISPMGVKGAAYATLLSQGVYSTTLFLLFLREKYQPFGNHLWKMKKAPFQACLKVGIPRALARFSALLAWNASVYFINFKGESYLIVLSVGSSIFLLISCFNEGMGQGLITFFSYLKERGSIHLVRKGIKMSFIFLTLSFLMVGIPLVLYPDVLIRLFVHQNLTQDTFSTLKFSLIGLWIFFWFEGYAWIGLSMLTALGKTLYLLKMNLIINWPTIFLPIFLGIYVGDWGADKIWFICSLSCITAGTLCLMKGLRHFLNSDEKLLEGALQHS